MSRSIKSLFKLLAISCVMMFFITCERDDIIPMESSENEFVLSSDEKSIPTITYQLSKAKSLESYFKGKGMAYTRATQSETIFTLPLGTVNLSSGLGIINEEAGKVTYSFPLHSFEKENGVLYSFILKENSDGAVSSSYILEYKMSDVFFYWI